MKIRSLVLALAVTGFSLTASAQKSAVNTAKTEYEKYAAMKGSSAKLAEPSMKAAKEAVDKAVAHEKTMNDPTAWTYKALIYSDIALSDTTLNSDAQAGEAKAAIAKATSLDKEGVNKDNIKRAVTMLGYYERGKGLRSFKAKKYAEAYQFFKNGLEHMPKDTIIAYYAGASAQNAGNFKEAIESYSSILDQKYSYLVDVYMNLAESYAANKDTTNAIKTLNDASEKFPEKTELVRRGIEFSLSSGRHKEVIDRIASQMAKEPTNKLYPFYLGIAYNTLNNLPKAEEAYKKAIEIDPAYGDAYLNLAGVIMNNGIELYNKANKVPTNKVAEYNAMKKKAMAEFDRALPFLNKAVELNPTSKLALQNLKQYYVIKNNAAKAAEVEAKLKAL